MLKWNPRPENGKKGRMKMTKKRRQFSAKFKAKVAVEAIKGVKTIAELSTVYKVHPNQISTWKKQLLANASELFPSGKRRQPKTEEYNGPQISNQLLRDT